MNRSLVIRTFSAGLVASAAGLGAQADLTYFWDQSTAGGVVTNDLQMITTTGGFTAQLLVNLSAGNVVNPSANDNPNSAAGDSYLGGGWNVGETTGAPAPRQFLDPLVAGVATNIGGSAVGAPGVGIVNGQGVAGNGSVNATWLFNLPAANNDNGTPGDAGDDFLVVPLPTGTILDPVFLARINLSDSASGTYSIRLSNSGGDVVQVIGGTVSGGVLSQRLVGDANLDGSVNLADFSTLKSNFGSSGASVLEGDFNGDDLVNLSDFSLLKANFGAAQPTSLTLETVPEPGTGAVFALMGTLFCRRRRRGV